MGTDDSGLTDAGRDSSMPGSDGGGDGGDECEGLTLCDTLGTSCDGDELVTCATNSDGCRVEVRDDCGADGDVCSVTGSTASCIDPCLLIPTAMRCDAAGRSCNGDSLEICTANEDGCFVLEATDCAAVPDGTCGMGDTMLQCLLPVDPCEAIPAAERCTVEGTSCVGNDLVTCAPDALGCLVTSEVDCTSRPGGSCDDVTTPAAPICVATNACAGITQCAAAGAECDGPELVTCSADAFGCLVETTEDCTAATFGFCDEDAAPVDACSTAATDPCMGVTQCGSAASRTCGTDGTTLTICEANAFGCFVAADTDCTTDGDVCDATGTMAMCVDPCSLVTVCPAATYCDGNAIVSCAADANSCLVETSRTACGTGEVCDGTGAAPMCVTPDLCPEAPVTVLNCATGTLTGNTAGGTTARSAYPGCDIYDDYDGAERIWRFAHTGSTPVEVEIVATRLTGTGDFDLYAWEDDGITSCTATTSLSCLDSSTNVGAVETVEFVAAPGDAAYVAYDIFSTTPPPPTAEFTLAITCTPILCGDGIRSGGETCDDGNTVALDGCSATCAVEAGYSCTSAEPSVCTMTCGNGVVNTGETCDDGGTTAGDGCSATCTVEPNYGCAGAPSVCVAVSENVDCASATSISSTTTLTNQHNLNGGPRPTGTGCGSNPGNRALYYSVTIPAHTRVQVTTATPVTSFDRVLTVQDACGAATCSVYTDSTPERATLTNSTAAPITQIVAVGSYGATTSGMFDITFTYLPVATNTTCATATPIAAATTITAFTNDGGPAPTATGCGGGTGTNSLYYAVTIPPGATVNAQTTPSLDIVLFTLDACTDAMCASSTDATPERATFTNTTGAAITRIVGVRPFGTAQGSFTIAFSYIQCGDGAVAGPEECDDGNTTSGDGCSATCAVEFDETVSATGLPTPIPDNNTTGITSTVTLANTCTIAAIRPTFSIAHGWAGDVTVSLTSPSGTVVVLTAGVGGSNDLVGPYSFASSASATWPGTGSPIPAGIYARDLSAFTGGSAAGTWTLTVTDEEAAITGNLTAWSLGVVCN